MVRLKLPDGREAVVLMDGEPFEYAGEGIEFDGTVGLVVRQDGKVRSHATRAATLRVR